MADSFESQTSLPDISPAVFAPSASGRVPATIWVSWRGIARDVRRGSYSFEAGQEVRVEVFDRAGRRLRRLTVPLSEFGTVHGGFDLSAEAPLGRWRLGASTPYGLSFQHQFEVAQ